MSDQQNGISFVFEPNEKCGYCMNPIIFKRKGLEGETGRGFISKDVAEDRTNHYNDGQGNFRYGILDIPELQERIFRDEQNAIGTPNFNHVLEITHCDEMDRIDEFKKYFANINTYDSPLIK